MKKKIFLTLLMLVVIVGSLAGIKVLQIRAMIDQTNSFVLPPTVVTSVQAQSESWETLLTAVGSLNAVQGVTVTAELTGKVDQITFKAGEHVAAGDLLVQQDISVEKARLRSAESVAQLARLDFNRIKKLRERDGISQADYDTAQAKLTQATAQVENIKALIERKTIRAPFAGVLGIREINLGQVINEGEAIVNLQTLDPIFVNFYLPQQDIDRVRTGLTARVTTDALPDQLFTCEITAISPEVDTATRNILVQGILANPNEQLRTGMYVNVTVVLPQDEDVLIIPSTAVLYAPYSDSVFVIEEKKDENGQPAGKTVRQQFVRLGEKRGDYITVLSGLTAADTIVSTGTFKLRNGQAVVVDNKLAPEFKLSPQPAEG
jgi:membrane fusion protein, multidrug efflux system